MAGGVYESGNIVNEPTTAAQFEGQLDVVLRGDQAFHFFFMQIYLVAGRIKRTALPLYRFD